MSRQGALALGLDPEPLFANFIAEGNEESLYALQRAAGTENGAFLSLWGAAGTGKSHLLQACCRLAVEKQRRAVYLALENIIEYGPESLEGFETTQLVCLDELDVIVGRPQWQEALHHLYNAIKQASGVLITASRIPPRELVLDLPDLKSRLGWGPCFHIQPLSDKGKRFALQQQALDRGMQLSEESANYLINRCSRDMHQLVALLAQLDRDSLAEQRRLSIPFIRQRLENLGPT